MAFHPFCPTPLMRSETRPNWSPSWQPICLIKSQLISVKNWPQKKYVGYFLGLTKMTCRKFWTIIFLGFSEALGFGSASASMGPSFFGFGMPGSTVRMRSTRSLMAAMAPSTTIFTPSKLPEGTVVEDGSTNTTKMIENEDMVCHQRWDRFWWCGFYMFLQSVLWG